MTDHDPPDWMTPAWLWSIDGVPYRDVRYPEGEDLSLWHLGQMSTALGFRRMGGSAEWSEGACIACGFPGYDRGQLSADRLCPACVELGELPPEMPEPPELPPPDPSAPYHEARWGERPGCPADELALELEGTKARNRARGRELARPYTRLPDSSGGQVPYRTKPGRG